MLGIALDVAAIWAIATLLAKQNMSDDWPRFLLLTLILLAAGIALMFLGLPVPLMLACYFLVVILGMKFVIGASWAGAGIGAVLFLGYKLLLGLIF